MLPSETIPDLSSEPNNAAGNLQWVSCGPLNSFELKSSSVPVLHLRAPNEIEPVIYNVGHGDGQRRRLKSGFKHCYRGLESRRIGQTLAPCNDYTHTDLNKIGWPSHDLNERRSQTMHICSLLAAIRLVVLDGKT
jgi:hypothetical protein